MRKHLKSVPVYIRAGNLPVDSADQAVAEGRAHSLRGKALLFLDSTSLEEHLRELEIDPDLIVRILRAAARVESEKAAAATSGSHGGSEEVR